MIELATNDDLTGVCDLLRVRHAEKGMGRVNETKALGVISQAIESGGCLVSRQREVIVGSVAVIKREIDEFSDAEAFFSRWFYVHPEHRNEGHAVRLIAALKQASRNTGLPLFLKVDTSMEELGRLRFFKKHLDPESAGFSFEPAKESLAA